MLREKVGKPYFWGATTALSQAFPAWANVSLTDQYRVLSGVLGASDAFSPSLVNEFSFGTKGHKREMANPDSTALAKGPAEISEQVV